MSNSSLQSLYRKKDIYIPLPSKGNFYPSGINLSADGDIGIMSMTAKDDLLLKSPDSLFNGQSIIEMIKSCVPDIENPEEMPYCDLDIILIAISAATKKKMDLVSVCEKCNTENEYQLDISTFLSKIPDIDLSLSHVDVGNNAIVNIRPYKLKDQLKLRTKTFNKRRIEKILNEDVNGENVEDLSTLFTSIIEEISRINLDLIAENIISVEINEEVINDPDEIKQWVYNMEKSTYELISERITKISEVNVNTEVKMACPSCEHKYSNNIETNPMDFFI